MGVTAGDRRQKGGYSDQRLGADLPSRASGGITPSAGDYDAKKSRGNVARYLPLATVAAA